MELFKTVDKYCNIRLLKKRCNFRDCDKKPGKEMLIFETTMNTSRNKDIVSIYLCHEHYSEMEKLLEGVIGKFRAGKVYKIKKDEEKIRLVTY